ncbi:hypothetical protein AAFC00_003803 [Neodothiora populina]|uniref:AAA+ ATPase domain-containing protein n=1 Tax=Neodothiora populina TaxID=2781224 RepID=A0ABR3PFS1_9PEZI
MVSVLGKRTRAPVCPAAAESTGVQTRAKRRSVAILGNNENDNPFITKRTAEEGDTESPETPTKTQTRPAKHGLSHSRVSTPNAKINNLFSVTKSASSASVRRDDKASPASTPQTPRHRDALSKKIAITPRHRLHLPGNSPATPSSPSTPSTAAANVYNRARQLFARCTDPAVLIGREEEKRQLSAFVSASVESTQGGCLYISGPPGTGKSAFVQGVCKALPTVDNTAMTTVNCMSVKSAKDLATTLCDQLEIVNEHPRGADFDFLRTYFLAGGQEKKYIVVLDEIDRLVDLDLKLLYNLFEWSMLPTSNLILIGIANALDLTDRFLPRLKSRSLKPELLPFMPYTAPQIANIITSKLQSLLELEESTTSAEVSSSTAVPPNFVPFLHPAAIQFISKKVASQTGDLRKAFDIASRAIALVESETKANIARQRLEQQSSSQSPSKTLATPTKVAPLMENINLASPPAAAAAAAATATKQTTTSSFLYSSSSSSLSHLTTTTAPRATIAHAAKITAQIFGNGATQRLAHLNVQQKAVLCTLASIEKQKASSSSALPPATPRKRNLFSTPTKSQKFSSVSVSVSTEPQQQQTVKSLYETYTVLCKRETLLHPLTSTEFKDVLSSLESASLIQSLSSSSSSSSFSSSSTSSPFSKTKKLLTPSRTPSRKRAGGADGNIAGYFGAGAMADDRKVLVLSVSVREVEEAVEKGVGSEIFREILMGTRAGTCM